MWHRDLWTTYAGGILSDVAADTHQLDLAM
jgi:hypothetical protein